MATDFSVIENIVPLLPKKDEDTKKDTSILDSISITSEEDKKLLQEEEKDLSFLEKAQKKLKEPIMQGYRHTVPGMMTEELLELGTTVKQSWDEGKLKEVRNLFTKTKEEGVIETDAVVEDEPHQLQKPAELDALDAISETTDYDISTLERIHYGFDKANFFLGHVWDIATAKVKDVFDDEKTLKEFVVKETERENEEFKKKHWKFADGRKDDDTLVVASELISHFLDPYWYAAYGYKPFRKILGTYKGFMGHSGAVVGLYNWVEQKGTKGDVDFGELSASVGIGAIFGGVTKGTFDTIAKIFPKASKKNLERIVTLINNHKAKLYGVAPKDLNKLRQIVNSKDVQALNNEIGTALKSLEVLSKESQLFIKRESSLLKTESTIKKLIEKSQKVIGGGVKPNILKSHKANFLNELAKIEKSLVTNEKTYAKLREKVLESGKVEFDKYVQKVANRNVLILEKLAANESLLTAHVIRPLLSFGTLPLAGSAVFGSLGIVFDALGNDDEHFKKWLTWGAIAGATVRGMRGHPQFSFATKDKIWNWTVRDNVKLAIQNARITFAATNAAKLQGYGGPTAQFGQLMLENIDSPAAGKAVFNVGEKWRMSKIKDAYRLVANYTEKEKQLAISIVQGNDDKALLNNKRVVKLADGIKSWLYNFQKDLNDVGIFAELEGANWSKVAKSGLTKQRRKKFFKIENYFPREYSTKIITDAEGFHQTIYNIYKSLGATDAAAKSLTKSYADKSPKSWDKLLNVEGINRWLLKDKVGKFNENFIVTPLTRHLTHERKLIGPYKLVEKVLLEKGYLNTDVLNILVNMANKSAKSYAFVKQFGPNGKFLESTFKGIKDKYQNSNISGKWNDRWAAERELKDVYGVINGYFDRYHAQVGKANTYLTGLLSTGSNLNMLDTVTIASLGDYIGGFTNSINAQAWFRSLPYIGRTTIGAASEWGPARNMNYHLTKDISKALAKQMAFDVGTKVEPGQAGARSFFRISTWLGSPEKGYRWFNDMGFKIMGLHWLTGNARRFNYNVGALDVYIQSRKLYKLVAEQGLKPNNPKVIEAYKWLDRIGVSFSDALKTGIFKKFDMALKNPAASKMLNESGWLYSNRDAIIPQTSNRLLFTMSRNPYLRLVGQFMSWAMGKSTQTHKMLQRIESGDIRTFIKMIAAVPVYASVQQVREIVKWGEATQSAKYNYRDWLAHGLRLSGLGGWFAEGVIGKFEGPGKREWYLPGVQWGKNLIQSLIGIVTNQDKEASIDRFNRKVAPLPNWIRRIRKWFTQKDIIDFDAIDTEKTEQSDLYSKGGSVRKKYNIGDEVNKKDIAAATIAATMAVNGANAEIPTFSEGVEQKYPSNELGVIKEEAEKIDAIDAQMAEAAEKKILPMKKPPVTNEIKYRNISELAPEKKAWLLDTSEKVYVTNTGNVIPNDIIIAMASGETGWGTSGFLNKGSNNLFNFQSFNGEEKSIAASGSDAKIKVFDKPEDSITELLTWIQN